MKSETQESFLWRYGRILLAGVIFLGTPGTAFAQTGKDVLMIVAAPGAMTPSESLMRERLVGQGYTVTLSDDNAAHPLDVSGYEVIFIAASVGSGNIAAKYRSTTRPVITAEAWVLDDMGMTGTTTDVDYGQALSQTQVLLDTPDHPIAGGLSGPQTVQTSGESFMWGVPGIEASIVGLVNGSSTQAALFTYDRGHRLADGTLAAGKRALLWMAEDTFDTANATAQALFDRTFEWALLPTGEVSASRTTTPIVIDGNVDAAWSGRRTQDISKVVLGSVSSRTDLRAHHGVLWDANFLYVLVEVRDDSLMNDSSAIFDDDSIDIYLDMNHDAGSTYGADDFMFQVGYGDTTVREYKHNATAGVEAASAAMTGGYRVELKIPWSTLGVTPSSNRLFGLDVLVNDDDDGGARDAQRAWNAYDANAYLYPDRFGDCRLVDSSVAGVTATPAPGSVAAGSTLTLSSATPGATLYYTTDGSDPRTSTTRKIYSSPIVANTLTVRAYATAPGMADSAVSSMSYTLNSSSYVNIVAHGATANDGTDDTAAIGAAISAAKTAGKAVFVPAGTFHHNNHLIFNAVSLIGTGSGSVLHATNDLKQNVRLTGASGRVSDVKLTSSATTRGETGEHQRLHILGATDFIIERVTVDGSHASGIFNYGGSRGVIRDCTVRNTMADGIHNTEAASHTVIEYNTVTQTGDDLIAVVSYQGDPGETNNITIRRNTVSSNTHGRGITVVGGNTILIEDNSISSPHVAGIYIASEFVKYNTFGVSNVIVRRNRIDRATIGHPDSGHGALMVYSSTSLPVTNITFEDNKVYNSQKMAVHINGASVGTVQLTNNLLQQTAGPGILIGPRFAGTLTATGNTVEETGQQGYLHVTPNASARITLEGNTFRNINSSGASDKDVIYLESGSLASLTLRNNVHTNPAGYALNYFIDERVSAGTQTISGNSSPRNSYIDGAVVPTP